MTSKRISREHNVNVEWSKDLKIDRDHGPDCEIKMIRIIYKIQSDWREAAQLVYEVDDDNFADDTKNGASHGHCGDDGDNDGGCDDDHDENIHGHRNAHDDDLSMTNDGNNYMNMIPKFLSTN